ncbi:Glucans biosynthesis protein G [Candidatus Methylacidithermus pantelleriae]|uniref:Glucans biosynthesis protein G n=2 Tax=Candidatus Methylacidithermus pantelleriae TaxID=2744239 RepID=A0A8J2BKP2_9BACT|nr:Glucans biosynthesis protein G [Candidatus Methylacidithermus pantelleriae]
MPLLSKKTLKIHLVFGTITAVLLFILSTQPPRRPAFSFQDVVEMARKKIREPRVLLTVPSFLSNLSYDQYRQIRWREEHTLWRAEGLPFQITFFHLGYLFTQPVLFNQVDDEGVKPIPYLPRFFDFGSLRFPGPLPTRYGYAGFRIFFPLDRRDSLNEVASFLGASYFRMVGKNQVFGLSARGIAVNTVAQKKEEFPAFTEFWLRKPSPNARELEFYGLLEGESVTGAYRFRLTPGEETRLTVRAVLFLRREVEEMGIAPLTSMFWYGENTGTTFGNPHPEVHDSDGLLVESSSGEWVWRPLDYGKTRRVEDFILMDPKGFGLLQRDREFSHYDDLAMLYNKRPSAWVEPSTRWGRGRVRLVQLPTTDANVDNVVAYWIPESFPQPGGRPLEVEYTIDWFSDHPQRPPLGRCILMRVDHQDAPNLRTYILDFAGDRLKNLPPDTPLEVKVTASEGGSVSDVRAVKNPFDQSWRVTFTVWSQPKGPPVHLRCWLVLKGEPLSETWDYIWTP